MPPARSANTLECFPTAGRSTDPAGYSGIIFAAASGKSLQNCHMNTKVFFGSILAYVYNEWLSWMPSRRLRYLYLKMALGALGNGTGIQLGCRFLNPRKIDLGERNVINFGCLLDGRKYRIKVGSDVSIGPEASILTLGHDPQSPDFSDRGGDVVIGNHVWIGYRAIILPGITVGNGAIVGAGSVVTRNVEACSIVAGNPARKIGVRRCDLLYRLSFDPWLG